MAEYILRERLKAYPHLSSFEVISAGISADHNHPASPFAIESLAAIGIDLQPHHSRPLSSSLLKEAIAIFCATHQHKHFILQNYPETTDHCFLIKEFLPPMDDLLDPYMGSREVYDITRAEIESAIPSIISYIQKHHEN